MNLRIQHHSPIEKPLAFLGDGVSCLSDAGLDNLDGELDFQNADHFHLSSDWIALLSVERPDNARPVNGDLMDSVRNDAIQMAILFVGDLYRLFDLAHNYRIPQKTMRECYAVLSHSEKRALQQEPSRVILCLFLGRSNQFSNSIRSRIAPVSATIAGDIAPHGVTGTSYDATSRRNLAGSAIVVARSLIKRAYSLRSNQIKDPTTDRTEALPGIVGLSAFRFGPHDEQSIMRGSASGQKSFAKGASHV